MRWLLDSRRFVVHPSEETKKNKAYEKGIEDFKPDALVRDRGGKRKRTPSPIQDDQDLDQDEKPLSPSLNEPAPPTAAQTQMEDAWGLRRENSKARGTPDSSDTEGAAASDSDPESDVDLKVSGRRGLR